MESTGSCTRSTAPAADTSLQSLTISDENTKVQAMTPEFKCQFCPRTFRTARGRGGHLKVHKHLRPKQIQKEHHRLVPAWSQLFISYRKRMHNFPSSARSGVVPLFARTGGHVGSGGHVGIWGQVNLQKTVQYYYWLRSIAMSFFVSQNQTGSGTSGLPRPSFAAPAPVAEGSSKIGDGIHLGGGQVVMPEVNQEETADGIDLTLRL